MEIKKIFVSYYCAQTAKGMRALIYNVVETKFTTVISLLEWPSLCSYGGVQIKHYTLTDVPVHGEQMCRFTVNRLTLS